LIGPGTTHKCICSDPPTSNLLPVIATQLKWHGGVHAAHKTMWHV